MISTCLDGIEPADLGLPSKFRSYRAIQREVSEFGMYGHDGLGTKRFTFAGAPAGCGKSLTAHTIGKLSGMRYVVATVTLGLQDQQVDDQFKVIDIRGKSNYPCHHHYPLSRERWTCAEGEDHDCPYAGTKECPYQDRVDQAKHGNVLTNYAYWMSARGQNRSALETPGHPIELLILDEFHMAPDALSQYLSTWISREHIAEYGPEKLLKAAMRSLGRTGKDWAVVSVEWEALLAAMGARAYEKQGEIRAEYETEYLCRRGSREYRELEKLLGDIRRVAQLGCGDGAGNWIWQATRNGVKFDCIWPYRYAEKYLFSGVEKVVGMSATLRPKCMSLLGLPRKEYDYKEWPRVFPAHLGPVYYWPLGRMGKNAPAGDFEKICDGIDEWFSKRAEDTHGLIHAVSFDRAADFQAGCKLVGRDMILSKPGEAATAAKRYREAKGRAVLCGPSFMVGYDFPDESGRVNIIPKIPFTNRSDAVFQAREVDPEYENHKVMQLVQQAAGRVNRHDRDFGETVVMDKNWSRFEWQAKEHKAAWFRTVKVEGVPELRAERGRR